MKTETLAKRIAEDLFKNGAGQRANRLVLEMDGGRNGGGWSQKPMAERIEYLLDLFLDNQIIVRDPHNSKTGEVETK